MINDLYDKYKENRKQNKLNPKWKEKGIIDIKTQIYKIKKMDNSDFIKINICLLKDIV